MTVGPWQMVAFPSTMPPRSSAISIPTAIASLDVSLPMKKKGLFAGATVKTGFINRDDESNRILYRTNFSLPEILYSDWVKPIPEVQPLMGLMQKIAP